MGRLGTFFVRFLQLVCTTVVLALSICAVRWQYRNTMPPKTSYATFAGAFGVLDCLLGLMAAVIGPLAGLFMLFLDILTAIFLLAGGIAYAVGLSGADCSDPNSYDTWYNRLINGGCEWNGDEQVFECSFWANSDLVKRCHTAKANTAFLFIAGILAIGVAVMSLMAWRKKRKGPTHSS